MDVKAAACSTTSRQKFRGLSPATTHSSKSLLPQATGKPEVSMKKVAPAEDSAKICGTVPVTVSKPREPPAGVKNKDNRNISVEIF
jgi:hypothetical protein